MQLELLRKLNDDITRMSFNEQEKLVTYFQKFKELIEGLEKHHPKDELLKCIPSIRKIAGSSPLIHRAQVWP